MYDIIEYLLTWLAEKRIYDSFRMLEVTYSGTYIHILASRQNT